MPVARLLGQFFSPAAVPQPLRWFYASIILRRAADALLLVISPVFLYQLGPKLSFISDIFPDAFRQGVLTIILVSLFGRALHLLLAQPLTRLHQKFGLRTSILLGQLIYFSIYIVYSFASATPDLIWIVPLLWPLVLTLYFNSYHLYLADNMETGKLGQELGTLEVLIKIALVISPLLGVLFSSVFGFQDTYLLAAALLLLSTVFLLTLPQLRFRTQWTWLDFWDSLKKRSYRLQWIGLIGKTWEEGGMNTFLPLFLFLSFSSIVEPGYILTSASFFSLIVVYLAGWSFDHSRNTKPVLLSGASTAVFWITRFFLIPFPIAFVVAETLERFSSSFFSLSFFAELVKRIRQNNPLIYVQNREIILDATVSFGSALLLPMLWLGWNWLLLFATFAIGSLLSLAFVKRHRKR